MGSIFPVCSNIILTTISVLSTICQDTISIYISLHVQKVKLQMMIKMQKMLIMLLLLPLVTQAQDQPQYMFGQFSPTFDTQGGLKKPAIRHRKQKTKRPNFEGGETGDGAKSETDQEIHYCQNCQFHTAHKQSLRRHMMQMQIHGIEFRTIPNESKRHPCFACEFRSDHITSLKRHIEKMHPDKQIPDPLY